MALRVAWALPLSLLLVLQGCENGAGGKDDKASCAHDDLMCLCKADCNETCNHFNITTVAQGTACAKCMTSKCAEDAKSLCPKDQTSLCHNCVTEGAWCWATTWPSCVKQCVQWWEPIECTQCWLTNYTANCLGKYHDCFEPHVDAPALTGSNVSAVVV
mmetsp:Transcript_92644/g.220457  ORF Transcript_92644/g.220457 Transcript_92644/m.220457 type:complete len:159 (-) Transcript_92644:72-548(-)